MSVRNTANMINYHLKKLLTSGLYTHSDHRMVLHTHTHTNKTGSNAIIIYQPSTCLPVYYNQIHSYVTSNCIQRNSIQVSIKTTLLIHIDYRNVKKRLLVQISYYRTITIYETFFWWKHYMFMCHTLSVIQRTQHLGLKVSPEISNRLIF